MCRGACAGTHRMPRLRRQECVECTNEIGRGWCVKAVPRSPARPHSVTLIDWAASPSGSGGDLARRPVAVDVDARRALVALGQVGGRRLWPVLLVGHQQALDEGDLPAAREGKGVSSPHAPSRPCRQRRGTRGVRLSSLRRTAHPVLCALQLLHRRRACVGRQQHRREDDGEVVRLGGGGEEGREGGERREVSLGAPGPRPPPGTLLRTPIFEVLCWAAASHSRSSSQYSVSRCVSGIAFLRIILIGIPTCARRQA